MMNYEVKFCFLYYIIRNIGKAPGSADKAANDAYYMNYSFVGGRSSGPAPKVVTSGLYLREKPTQHVASVGN